MNEIKTSRRQFLAIGMTAVAAAAVAPRLAHAQGAVPQLDEAARQKRHPGERPAQPDAQGERTHEAQQHDRCERGDREARGFSIVHTSLP